MKRIFQSLSVSRLYLALSTLDHFSSSTISSFQWQNCKQRINWESGNNAGKCLYLFWYEYLSFYNACAVVHSPEYCKIFDLLLNTPQQRFVKAMFRGQISESGKEVEKGKRCSLIENILRRNNFPCFMQQQRENTKFSLIDVLELFCKHRYSTTAEIELFWFYVGSQDDCLQCQFQESLII